MGMNLIKGMTESDVVFEQDLSEGTWYRGTRNRNTSHLWAGPDGGSDTICGLSLWLPEEWWQGTTHEAELGDQWLVEENRKEGSGRCPTCKKMALSLSPLLEHRKKDEWKRPVTQTVWPTAWWERGSHTSLSGFSGTKLQATWFTVCGWEDQSAPF